MKIEEKQRHAPLAEAMKAYAADGATAFHTPGHKQGRGAHPLLRNLITEEGLREEVSLMEELDDLHEPTMCIREAQQLAAELYGADQSYFMINGTTGAIHAMLMASLKPGDQVLVPRNAHRSILGGLILCGAQPVFIQPEVSASLGIAMGLVPEDVEQAVERYPEACALVAVYPTYYGVTSDLQAIANIVHAHDMLLLVDEAHGAHLRFSDALPAQALDCGADLVAQSTHKLLGSLTQTSMLHARAGRIDMERVRTSASLLQSTSPDYLLLASLDIARMQMATEGWQRMEQVIWLVRSLRSRINALPGLWCPGPEDMRTPGATGLDETKLTVQVRGLGMTGTRAEYILRHTCKIQCELADAWNVLFLFSMADTERETELLYKALTVLSKYACEAEPSVPACALPPIPPMRLVPRKAFFAPSRPVAIKEALHKVVAETITFYPPGIPVIYPGEVLTDEILAYVLEMQRIGLKVVGPQDAALQTLRISE